MNSPHPTERINIRMGFTEWSALLGLALLWGVSFFTIAIAVKELQPLTIVALRVGIAAIVLWVVILVSRTKVPNDPGLWFAMGVMGCLNNVIPFSLIVYGQQSIPGGLASILNGATPFFTVIVAGLLLSDERINRWKLIGTLLGFSGVAVMMGGSLLGNSSSGGSATLLAQLAILGAALSYAFAGTWGRRFRGYRVPMTVIAAGQLTTSTLVMVPLALVFEKPLEGALPSAGVISAMLVLAILCTAVAYLLYFRVLSSSGAVNISLVTLLIPVSAIILGTVFLDERLGIEHALGMLLIALGMSLVDGRLWKLVEQ